MMLTGNIAERIGLSGTTLTVSYDSRRAFQRTLANEKSSFLSAVIRVTWERRKKRNGAQRRTGYVR